MKRHFRIGRWNRHGRAIPDPQVSELDNEVPLRPTTKDSDMDNDYRRSSSAFTGRAPRTTEQRWPSHPVSAPRWFERVLRFFCGF